MQRNEFDAAKKVLNNSGIVAFPTETVMGLGVFYDDYEAYQFLNSVKRRPEEKPYTLMVSGVSEISKYAYVDDRARKVIDAFMPGEITILLRSKDNVPGYVTHDTGIIGIRVPNLPELLEFLSFIKKPLLVPSANRSGDAPLKNSEEVEKVFSKEEVGYIFKGKAIGGVPSTLVDLTGKEVKIYREGNIKLSDIIKVIEEEK